MTTTTPKPAPRLQFRLLLVLLLFLALELAHEKVPFRLQPDHADHNFSAARQTTPQRPDSPASNNAQFSSGNAGTSPAAASPRPAGATFTLLTQSPGQVRFRFELGEFSLQEITRPDGTYSRIILPQAQMLQRRGHPELPIFRTDFALLPNARAILEITASQQQEIPCLPPLPSPGEQLWTERSTTALPDPAIYNASTPYPPLLASLAGTYQLRQVFGQSLQVSPLQYLPQEGKLLVCRSFEATLTFLDEDGSESRTLPRLDDNGSFASLQSQLFLNSNGLTRGSNPSVGQLLFIFPDGWNDALNAYVLWKRRLGFQVSLARYPTDTGSGSSNIASYLANAYSSNSLTHAVIIGDWDLVPPSRVTSGPNNVPPGPNASRDVTSDAPYACLAGSDFKADILLSRISVRNTGTLAGVLAKLQEYEDGRETAAGVWQQHGLFLASADGNSATPFDWNNRVEPIGKVSKDYAYIDHEFNTLTTAGAFLSDSYKLYANHIPTPTASGVSDGLNAGVSLLYYLGHGQINYYSTSGFSSTHAQALTNAGKLPFVMAPVCHTGNFAYTQYDCLSEALLNHSAGGATAVIACSGESYWRAPIVSIWAFTDSILAADTAQRPLDNGSYAWNSISRGIDYCLGTTDDEQGSAEYFMHLMHLFGDCSQVPRIGAFRELTVDYAWTADGLLVTTTWDDAAPAPYTAVCLEIPDVTFVSGRTGSDGQIVLDTSRPLVDSILRISDPSAPVQEIIVAGTIELDQDQDGKINHQELLAWLSNWLAPTSARSEFELQSALAQWTASGWQGTRTVPPAGAATDIAKTYPAATSSVRINCPQRSELDRLADTGVDIVSREGDVAIVYTDDAGVQDLLAQGFEILSCEPLSITPETRGVLQPRTSYPTFAETNAALLELARDNRDFLQPSFVGKSTQGREILAARLSLAPPGSAVPELLIVGGIHGDERPSVDMPLRLLEYLVEMRHASSDEATAVRALLQNCALWILPLLNPDGMVSGSRYNSKGADLNRNFPDGVLLGQAGDPLGTFRNADSLRLAGLQQEQIVIMRWLAARNITAALHLHTGAELVCFPYGNYIGSTYYPHLARAPHETEFLDLGQVYADANPRISTVRNAASWFKVIGELADWQYRYLGTLPLTVELVGPSNNKEPAYATMDTIWQENQPAFLAWMQRVIELYPQGLPESGTRSDPDYSAEFLSTSEQYLPGFAQSLKLQCAEFTAGSPEALILTLTLPGGWQADIDLTAALPARSVRRESASEFSFLFLPEDGDWGDRSLSVSATPPEDISAEAILNGTLHWLNDSSTVPPQHWLPLPERDFEQLTLQAGWNLLALPLTPKRSFLWPTDILFTWDGNKFQTETWPRQGVAFWTWQEHASELSFSGWHRDDDDSTPIPGWQLRGSTWPQTITNFYRTGPDRVMQKIPVAVISPPEAVWIFQ